ncbi:MAG TPA: hypothetical protein VFG45_00160 [Candidatus Nitrosocosmicus sp.]|nr:hypothetical protein [Candidatus Nitrosocosmicus sp.]
MAYKHEAISKVLSPITLSLEINRAEPAYSDFYRQANYTLQFNNKTIYSENVEFSITIPKTVKNTDGTNSFVRYIISKNGSQLLKNHGLNPINITYEGKIGSIPLDVKHSIQ